LTAGTLRAAARRGRRQARSGKRSYWRLADAPVARVALVILVLLLLALQLRLWTGDGGVHELWRLRHQIEAQERENAVLRERNEGLEAEVVDLKDGAAAIEERARRDLSMIRRDETFFQSVEP